MERVRRVETTHYRVEIDKEKALQQMPADRREKAKAALAQISSKQFNADVWIDDDQLPRKISMTLDGRSTAGSPFKMVSSNEFFDYGDPVEIAVPADTDVFEAPNYEAVLQATIRCNPTMQGLAPGAGPGTPSATPSR
jgi:hypothetical protein